MVQAGFVNLSEIRGLTRAPQGRKLPVFCQLLAAAEAGAERRRHREAEAAAREKSRRDREEAEARERRLAALARREAEAWREVDALIASRQRERYDEAVALLVDLNEVCVRAGRDGEAAGRIDRLRREHARKTSLMERLRRSGLLT